MRAQASFVLILGMLLLIVIIIYYASRGFVPVPVVGEEQKMVQEMVEGIITSGAELSLNAMERQGGYLIPPNESVAFANIGVPYWQICNNDFSPTLDEIKERFEDGIEYYVNIHTEGIGDFFGKNLSLSNVSRVDVNILENRIDISVHMTTRFQGYPIKQPYTVSVPTRFKQLFSFAKDTIAEINKNPSQGGRFFETFTVASLYHSRHLPTIGFLTECGQSIHLTPQHVSQRLNEMIIYTITHFDWWQEMPDSRTYAVEYVNGRQYLSLDPMLFLPQGFEVRSSGSVNIQNNEWISYVPFPVPYCTTAYNIKYSVSYPVVIIVNDPETGYDFNFAVYVNVDNMVAGDCDVIDVTPGEEACTDLPCYANIRISDCNGNPLEGASAYFDDCFLGESGSDGNISGGIACGTHQLDVYHSEDYDYYFRNVSSTVINRTYTLCKKTNLTAYFYRVDVEDWGYDVDNDYLSCYPCASPVDCPDPFTWDRTECDPVPADDVCVWINLTSEQTGNSYMITNSDPEEIPDECIDDPGHAEDNPGECSVCTLHMVDVDNIPAGRYNLVAELRDPVDYKYVGYFEVNGFELYEETEELFINIPKFGSDTYQPESWQKQCVLDKLIDSCGIEPLRQT